MTHTLKVTTYLYPDNLTLYKVTVFLRGFRTLGSTGPIEKLKGSHEEKSGSQFLDTVNSMFSQV